MNDESPEAPPIAAVITARVTTKTAVLAGAAALAGFVYALVSGQAARPWSLPGGILFGGLLGLLNFRWLARAVERLYLKKGTHVAVSITAAEVLHVLKLLVVFVILFIVIKWQLVNLIGLIIGLSLCFLSILWEGLTAMRRLQ
jgi:hypothetical protein